MTEDSGPTQTQLETQADDDFGEDPEGEGEEEEQSEDQGPWGTLLPVAEGVPHIDLMPRPRAPDGRINRYVLGRAKACDIKFSHKKISSSHCTLYCVKSGAAARPHAGASANTAAAAAAAAAAEAEAAGAGAGGGAADRARLEVYIEDHSANGTWVNTTTRLQKTRRLLHTGDEIALVNPEIRKKADGSRSEEVLKNTFLIRFDLKKTGQRTLSHGAGTANMLRTAMGDKKSTVVRMLDSNREMENYYDVRDLLGSGSCGRVFRGIQKETGQEWAIKAIDMRQFIFAPGGDPRALIHEAEMLRRLHHPYIIKLNDVFSNDTTLFMVMELVTGGDLFDRVVAKGHYEEEEARQLLYRLLLAIQYLHENDIVHRDLKPENILLTSPASDIDIKITDFGLAKDRGPEGLKTYCGTPNYLAPEVLQRQNTIEGRGRYGPEADMWSVGVVLFVLLSGTAPFADDTLYEQISHAQFGFVGSVWDSVSDDAKDLVRRLICRDGSKRLTVDQCLEHAWLAPLKNDPAVAETIRSAQAEVRARDEQRRQSTSGEAATGDASSGTELVPTGTTAAASASATSVTAAAAAVAAAAVPTGAAAPPVDAAVAAASTVNGLGKRNASTNDSASQSHSSSDDLAEGMDGMNVNGSARKRRRQNNSNSP